MRNVWKPRESPSRAEEPIASSPDGQSVAPATHSRRRRRFFRGSYENLLSIGQIPALGATFILRRPARGFQVNNLSRYFQTTYKVHVAPILPAIPIGRSGARPASFRGESGDVSAKQRKKMNRRCDVVERRIGNSLENGKGALANNRPRPHIRGIRLKRRASRRYELASAERPPVGKIENLALNPVPLSHAQLRRCQT